MYILKFLHFAKENRPKRISDNAYLALSADEASHYKHENDETEYAPAIDNSEPYFTSTLDAPVLNYPISDSQPTNDEALMQSDSFSGFGGGDFGGAGSSGSWSDDSSSSSLDSGSSSYDSGSSSYDSGSSSYDSGSSSDSSSSSSDW